MTTSLLALAVALVQLGFKPYDWGDRLVLGHLSWWRKALCARLTGDGKIYGQVEFDKLTKDFDVISLFVRLKTKHLLT